jgi:hypothetical protein
MSNNMINTHKPISMASLKQFREGWNAASKGTLITQNPYPEDHAPMASWNLWTNGYNDYMASSYNCIAHNFYHQFGADKDPVRTDADRRSRRARHAGRFHDHALHVR